MRLRCCCGGVSNGVGREEMMAVAAVAPEPAQAIRAVADSGVKIAARDVNVYYGEKHALKHVDIDIRPREVTAFIGPSGCGKSTFLRSLNRMNDVIEGCRVTGSTKIDGEDIYARPLDVVQLRARVGMVFQKPNPFPKAIFDNVAYGPRIHGIARSRPEFDLIVERR